MTAFTIGTWNCRMAIDRKGKREAIERLACDVLVVPECKEKPSLYKEPAVSFQWRGLYPRKGLGVFGFNGWRLERAEESNPLPWLLPLHVIDPAGSKTALLLAIWTVANAEAKWPSYAGQVAAVISEWGPTIRTEPVILAGDFNCSGQGPSSQPHLANVARLEEMGARSAYHVHRGVAHGEEPDITLRWVGRGKREYTYHCDFIFLSSAVTSRPEGVTVGTTADWIESRLSDHVPVKVKVTAS